MERARAHSPAGSGKFFRCLIGFVDCASDKRSSKHKRDSLAPRAREASAHGIELGFAWTEHDACRPPAVYKCRFRWPGTSAADSTKISRSEMNRRIRLDT